MECDVVDVTGLDCRGFAENAAGEVVSVGPGDKPEHYAELVLRVAFDDAFSAESLRGGFDNEAVAAWLESVGAQRVRDLAVFRSPDGRYTLHVSQFPEGYPMDYAAGEPMRVARRIDIGTEPTWPECLNLEVFAPKRSAFIFAAENEPTPEPEG